MKDRLVVMATAAAGVVYAHIGEMGLHLKILLVLMAVDYVWGIAMSFAGKSKKGDGTFDSKESRRGLLQKGMCLTIVLVSHLLDSLVGSSFISDMVILAFIANEGLSILEHAVLLGVPVPPALRKVLSALKEKAGELGAEKVDIFKSKEDKNNDEKKPE